MGESDADEEIMENKRFPQQRFSPINPVRARSATPKRGRYFSPIPVSRPWTPDLKTHHRSLFHATTDALAKYRGSSTPQQREYSPALAGTKTKSQSLLQTGRTSAFTSIESNRTVATEENSSLSSSAENNVVKSLPQISSSEGLLSASLAQRSASWSLPARTAFQTKPSQMTAHHPSSTSTSSHLNRAVVEMSSLDKSPMADAQYGRSIPQLVYNSDGSVRIDGGAFTSQALQYHQIPPPSYIHPFVAFPYAGLHLQDKVMSPFGVQALPAQLPASQTALLRSNPVVNTLISPVLNIQVQSSITSGHSTPPNGVQYRPEKLLTTAVTGGKCSDADTPIKSDDVKKQLSQSPALLSETATTRKDSKTFAQKDGKTTKNILKKFVPDGMEQ